MPWFIIDTREHFSTHLISTHIPNFRRVGAETVMKLYNMMVSSLPNAIHVHISPFKVHTDGVIFSYLGKNTSTYFSFLLYQQHTKMVMNFQYPPSACSTKCFKIRKECNFALFIKMDKNYDLKKSH